MSHKDVQDSQHHFVPAKRGPDYKRGKTTFLDGIRVSKEKEMLENPVEFHYKDGGVLCDDTNGSYAMRKLFGNGHVEFFVKFATAGPDVGHMLNPWGLYFQPGDEVRYEKTMGRKRYEFKKVTDQVFDLYIQFLKTRNERQLRHAEKESINA
jgi:hypothetical protein